MHNDDVFDNRFGFEGDCSMCEEHDCSALENRADGTPYTVMEKQTCCQSKADNCDDQNAFEDLCEQILNPPDTTGGDDDDTTGDGNNDGGDGDGNNDGGEDTPPTSPECAAQS